MGCLVAHDDGEAEDLDLLLDHLRETRGVDFTGYKRSSLARRVRKRMDAVRCPTLSAYRAYLDEHDDEFAELFNTILINVTSFFRDPETWQLVRDVVVPAVVAGRGGDEPVRAWVAGCASGEEAYTVAALLCEALGEDAFRQRVKVYATDADHHALSEARRGRYPRQALVENVPPDLVERYFEADGTHLTFRKDLRRAVIFGAHNLVQDPPISRIDLLCSRNTLMYFTPETQRRVMANFYFALNEGGLLLLGKSEVMLTRSNLFVPVDLRLRVFERVDRATLRDQLLSVADLGRAADGAAARGEDGIREAAFETGTAAQIVVTEEGVVALANQQARLLFDLGTPDVGRNIQDLEVSYRPLELRSLIERAQTGGQPVTLTDVEWSAPGGTTRFLDVQVIPLRTPQGRTIGTNLSFAEVTKSRNLQQLLEVSKHELETAYEELQATAEELETTNEELQSTNEELETTNEELQSTNEELETMNEELQSTNEELQTMNDELRRATDELNDVNGFFEAILSSLRGGVVVLDRELRVLAWSDHSTELWGLRADEVEGEYFPNLDIGLPVAQLHEPIGAALAGEEVAPLRLSATNRRGRVLECVVSCAPLRGRDDTITGAILVVDDRPPAGA
jgi:two-component system, chemotaxis family, CheB/CheR fusion protein